MGNKEFGHESEADQEKRSQQAAEMLSGLLQEGQALIQELPNDQSDTISVQLSAVEMVAAVQGATLFLPPQEARTMILKITAEAEKKYDAR